MERRSWFIFLISPLLLGLGSTPEPRDESEQREEAADWKSPRREDAAGERSTDDKREQQRIDRIARHLVAMIGRGLEHRRVQDFADLCFDAGDDGGNAILFPQ